MVKAARTCESCSGESRLEHTTDHVILICHPTQERLDAYYGRHPDGGITHQSGSVYIIMSHGIPQRPTVLARMTHQMRLQHVIICADHVLRGL